MEAPGILTTFLAGIVSFLSPCVLPLVPPYLSYISGVSVELLRAGATGEMYRRVVKGCIFFVLGFSVVFTAMGASATWVGQLLRQEMFYLRLIAGTIVILFGLHLIGVLRIGALYREKRFDVRTKGPGTLTAFLLGLAFAFGWTPCIGPILGAVLAYASTQETVAHGMALLIIYSLGLGMPFILSALAVNAFFKAFNSLKRYLKAIEVASGILLIGIGILILTNNLIALAGYLSFLNRFAW